MTDQTLSELQAEADQRRVAIARDVELVTDRVAPARIADRQKARIRQRVTNTRDSVFGTSDNDRRAGANQSETLRDKAGNTIDHLKDSTPDSVEEFTEGNPLAAGLVGIGLGLLAATLIPSTREEQRLANKAQDTIDSAAAQLAHAGQETAEAMQPAVADAAKEVKSSAQESVQTVKDGAHSATDELKNSAQNQNKPVHGS